MSRRNEAKDSAMWHVRARPQLSVMRFDNRPTDRQPKPQAARFRGIERLEHSLKSRRREARTRIPHLDRHAIRFVTAADEQFPLLFADVAHRFDGIDDQVEQYLLQLDPISLNARQALRQLRPYRYAIVCGLRTGENDNLEDGIVDLYGVFSCGRLLNECADSPDDLACAIPFLDNKRERVIHFMKIWRLRA